MRSLNHQIIELLGEHRRALPIAEIATLLGTSDRHALGKALDELVYDGLVRQRNGQRYGLAADAAPPRPREVEAIFHQNPRGFGFLKLTGQEDDVFVPAECIGGAMHGDRVAARVVASGRRGPEGEVVSVLHRARKRVVGVLRGRAPNYRIELDDQRVRGPVEIVLGAELAEEMGAGFASGRDGTSPAAVVELVRYPEHIGELPKGRLLAVLGAPGEPDVEVKKILLEHAVDEEQPEAAVLEAQAYGSECDPAELARRVDLRHKKLVTIDPKTARDHDDAVWVERDEHGDYHAWIAIADVSWYVRHGSALDANALARGNSVYLPDRSVPMLPRELSSNLCSLLAQQDRLCMCVEVTLDATGAPKHTKIYEAAMRCHAFLTYDSVARALGFSTVPERDPEAEAMRHELQVMWELSSELRKRRMRRGSLDLDLPESDIVLDDTTRAPVEITLRDTDPGVRKAYRLVEELMLLANEEVARYVLERQIPSVFRVHGAPDPEKLQRFGALCEELDLEFDAEAALDPKSLSRFLRTLDEHPKKHVLHMLLLRAMQQAQYDPTNIGHFGLASAAYLHFTSPIRRYSDLVVHRLLRRALKGERIERGPHLDEELKTAALTASERERDTMEAERGIADLYRALYMRSRLGESFEGNVVTITQSGLFLQLEEPYVSVLVLFDDLGAGGYAPDENHLRVSAKRSGDSIALGDTLLVTIVDVSLVRRLVYGRRVGGAALQGDDRRGKDGKRDKTGKGDKKGKRGKDGGRDKKGRGHDEKRTAHETPKRAEGGAPAGKPSKKSKRTKASAGGKQGSKHGGAKQGKKNGGGHETASSAHSGRTRRSVKLKRNKSG